VELAVVFDPEDDKDQKRDDKKDKLRQNFFKVSRELSGGLAGGQLWHSDPQHEQGHGERKDCVHQCLQPPFGDAVGIVWFKSAHIVYHLWNFR
jgi:hypothetical protein